MKKSDNKCCIFHQVFSVPLVHRCSPLQMATYRIRPVLAVIKKTSVIAFIKKRNYTCVSHKVWEACLLGPKVPRFIPSTCPKGSCRIWNLEFPPEISENQLKLHKFKAIFKFLGCKCFARVLLPSFPALDSYFY